MAESPTVAAPSPERADAREDELVFESSAAAPAAAGQGRG